MKSHYVLRSRWQLCRDRESVWDEVESLLAGDEPLHWWPSVHAARRGSDLFELRTGSHLGYTLRFTVSQLRPSRPERLTFRADGDLRGYGVVTFVAVGDETSALEIHWQVSTVRRWMRWTSWLLRPAFVAGHHLVMGQGQKHLNAYLTSAR